MSTAPVFIVGCPRSGTTYLYHLLLSAGGFAIYRAEAQFYNALAPIFGNFRSIAMREAFLKAWLQTELFKRSGLDITDIEDQILDSCTSPGDCQAVVMNAIANRQGAHRWSDCTPENVLHMLKIKRDFPDALFVHIIRDGRDVALSLSQQGWVRPAPWHRRQTILAAGAYWDWIVGRGRKLGARIPGSYYELQFESLVQDRDNCLKELFEFVGQVYDRNRITEHAIGSVERPNTSFSADVEAGEFDPVERWRRNLPPEEQASLESCLAGRLRELSYPVSSDVIRSNRVSRLFYFCRFSVREWLKGRPLLARYFADRSLLEWTSTPGPEHWSTRPREHQKAVSALVCPDRESEEQGGF